MTDARERVAPVFGQAPFIQLVGYRLVDAGEGWVESALTLAPHHLQQHGYVHAGVMTTMADHTAGSAATTVIPETTSILTADLAVNFLRPARGGEMTCRATVIKAGRTLCVTEADVHSDGVHVARLHATMAVVDRRLR